MENNLELENQEMQESSVVMRFSPDEERQWYINLKNQLIKLLYLIEAEERGEESADLFFYGFMLELASSNTLCHNKLTKVVVKIHGLYDGNKYKEMAHTQIKRQIMESRGIVDHLIKELSDKK